MILGKVGFVIYSHYFEPASESKEDLEAQEIAMEFSVKHQLLLSQVATKNIFDFRWDGGQILSSIMKGTILGL